jgi:hypothetical protein
MASPKSNARQAHLAARPKRSPPRRAAPGEHVPGCPTRSWSAARDQKARVCGPFLTPRVGLEPTTLRLTDRPEGVLPCLHRMVKPCRVTPEHPKSCQSGREFGSKFGRLQTSAVDSDRYEHDGNNDDQQHSPRDHVRKPLALTEPHLVVSETVHPPPPLRAPAPLGLHKPTSIRPRNDQAREAPHATALDPGEESLTKTAENARGALGGILAQRSRSDEPAAPCCPRPPSSPSSAPRRRTAGTAPP